MNLQKLKGKITEKEMSYAKCANNIGVSLTTFSDKMNGKRKFYVEEANELSIFLDLSIQDRFEIFFD